MSVLILRPRTEEQCHLLWRGKFYKMANSNKCVRVSEHLRYPNWLHLFQMEPARYIIRVWYCLSLLYFQISWDSQIWSLKKVVLTCIGFCWCSLFSLFLFPLPVPALQILSLFTLDKSEIISIESKFPNVSLLNTVKKTQTLSNTADCQPTLHQQKKGHLET